MKKSLIIIIITAIFRVINFFILEIAENIPILLMITIIYCIFIFASYNIDIEKRQSKKYIVWIIGIILVLITVLLIIFESVSLYENFEIDRRLGPIINELGAYFGELFLNIIILNTLKNAMSCFSEASTVKKNTDWFYKNETD